jgi:hypothetical protein
MNVDTLHDNRRVIGFGNSVIMEKTRGMVLLAKLNVTIESD